ncbi:MAG TPA: c-type cytochrome [Burkholderiales bacterium]
MSTSADHDEHSSFIKTPQQLIVVILASFLVPIFGIVLLVQLVLGHPHADPGALTADAIASRIQPVGRVEFGPVMSGAPAAPAKTAVAKAGPADGKSIYNSVCMACHASGVANAPKLGDKAAWAPRIKTGAAALLQSVTKGKGAMPPRAGTSLSEAELRAAIDFMTSQSK